MQEGPRKGVWRKLIAWSGAGIAAGLAAYAIGLGSGGSYLALQAASDPLHRFAILILPLGLGAVGLLALAARLTRRWPIAARTTSILAGTAWLLVMVTGGTVARFDRAIEQRGLLGELRIAEAGSTSPMEAGAIRGPYLEDPEGPGVATEPLETGDLITLDRRTLARQGSDGAIRWSLRRPGWWPASITLVGGTILFAGPGPDFDDDVVVAATDLETGRPLWAYHCLGNLADPPALEGDELALVALRPSIASVHLLRWTEPRWLWSAPLGAAPSPPALTPRGVEVQVGTETWVLDRTTGEILRREPQGSEP